MGHICPDVFNGDYQNVSALLSKNGNEGASDQVCMVLILGICPVSLSLEKGQMIYYRNNQREEEQNNP